MKRERVAEETSTGSGRIDSSRRKLSRRGFLQSACVAPSVGSGFDFGDLLSAVANEPVVDTSVMTTRPVDTPISDMGRIVDGIQDGQLLEVPPGEIPWKTPARVVATDWGIRCSTETTFEVPPGTGVGTEQKLLQTNDENTASDNFLLENLTFESERTAAPSITVGAASRGYVNGLHYDVDGPKTIERHANGLAAFVSDSDGTLRVDDYRQSNNGNLGGYASGTSRIGIYVGRRNLGTVDIRRPMLSGFPNNACYVSRQPGTVRIQGGILANNNVSAVRVSGGVEVDGTTIYIDTDRYRRGPGIINGRTHNTRGLWGDNRNAGTNGGVATNVSFVLQSFENISGLVDILENQRMTVRESQFLLNDDVIAVNGDPGTIRVLDSKFDGTAVGSIAGAGSVMGGGNTVNPEIYPGEIPKAGEECYEFDWSKSSGQVPREPGTYDHAEHTLSIRSVPRVEYTLTTTGEMVAGSSADDPDSVTQNSDGTWTAHGGVDGGDLDTFRFDGRIVSWQTDAGLDTYTLVLDGNRIMRGN